MKRQISFCVSFLLCLTFWACLPTRNNPPEPPKPPVCPDSTNPECPEYPGNICFPHPADSTIYDIIDVPDIFGDFDTYFRKQGYLHYSGIHGLPDWKRQAAIDILPAWEITKGAGIKIAVFDENIQSKHEDLANILTWNVLDASVSCDPIDPSASSHGTAVSGLIIARENGIGIIGVAPESDFLFIGDSTEKFRDSDVLKAFEYAKNWGARVISCSWGSYNASQFFENLVKDFYNQGITIVFACGNEGINLDDNRRRDESELPWVIGVSSSNQQGVLANFSNYGNNIDIMAPGERIYTLSNDYYEFRRGTSFSAPIVAGVAALMLSANPSLTPTQIRQIIFDTARKTPPESDRYTRRNGNCFSLYHAHGLINAGRAVRKAAGLDDEVSE